jgi:hypothetical protein
MELNALVRMLSYNLTVLGSYVLQTHIYCIYLQVKENYARVVTSQTAPF